MNEQPIPECIKLDKPNPLDTRPRSVAVIGLGPSCKEFLAEKARKNNPVHYDEVWGINTTHRSIKCDKIWTMDDLAKMEQNYPDWANELKLEETPIITCRTHPDYPNAYAYPLDDVTTRFKDNYFTTTVAYIVAYAAYIGVEDLYLFGLDFYYPNAMVVESGMGCVAYWLGIARENGVHFKIPSSSTLLDSNMTEIREENGKMVPHRILYGYDYNPQDANRKVSRGTASETEKEIASWS